MRKLEEEKVLNFHHGRSRYSSSILNGVWRTGISYESLVYSFVLASDQVVPFHLLQ